MSGAGHPGLLDVLPIGAAVLDEAGTILEANSGLARLVRLRPEELRGRGFFEAFGSVPAIRAARDSFLAAGGALRLDAGEFRVRLVPYRDGERHRTLVFVEDVAGGKEAGPAARRLDEVLETVSGVRHDVNNALMGLMGQIEIFFTQPDVPEAVLRRVEKIRLETERVREKVARLSTLRKT